MGVPCVDCAVLGETNNLICPRLPKLKLTVSALHLPLPLSIRKMSCILGKENKAVCEWAMREHLVFCEKN